MTKKVLLALLILTHTLLLNAQPVIHASDYPVGGEQFFGYVTDTGFVDPGSSGENVVWNYSSLNPTKALDYTSYDCNGAYCDTFTGSTFFNKTPTFNYSSYYVKNASGIFLNGYVDTNGVTNKFTNSQQLLMFPIQYNSTFADTFANAFYYPTIPVGISDSGYNFGVIDAYGTLQTPRGIYTNVLRLKLRERTNFSNGNYEDETNYEWFHVGSGHSIMDIYQVAYSDQSNIEYSYRYTTMPPNNVSSISNVIAAGYITIYPNPAQGLFRIKTNNLGKYDIVVRDIVGKTFYNAQQKSSQHEAEVLTTNWTKGIYLVEIKDENGRSFIQKITVL